MTIEDFKEFVNHNKNFSFILGETGRWRIAPAYDITFIFNTNGNGPNIERRLSVGGKTADITKSDLLEFAKQNDIKNAGPIINRVADAIGCFNEYAEKCRIRQPWHGIIQKTLSDNLSAFGYLDRTDNSDVIFYDKYSRTISHFSITVNTKGLYEVTAIIDRNRQRRFVRPNMSLYSDLSKQDIFNLPVSEKIRLIETLFLK